MTLSMRSVLLLHLFQIWGEKGHFLRWTHKKSPCCCSRLRSSLSPILNSSLYCMPIMWVLQKCRVSLAWLPSRPKAQLCQVVWYLNEGRIFLPEREYNFSPGENKNCSVHSFHCVRFPKRERAGWGNAVYPSGFCQCQCVRVSESALVEVWEKDWGLRLETDSTILVRDDKGLLSQGLASWKGMTHFRRHFCVESVTVLWTTVIEGDGRWGLKKVWVLFGLSTWVRWWLH